MKEGKKNALCGNCTLKLVAIAYRRALWFRLLREPLKLGMRLLARIHCVDTSEYLVRTPACYNCIRFYKVALKERSAVFRRLHKWINPLFDRAIGGIVTTEEKRSAKEYAEAATQGRLDRNATEGWMRGMKTGF
jgi:hypothetical protein